MTASPIVAREMRVAARQKGTYWVRFSVGLGVVVLWAILVLGAHRTSRPAQMGESLFIAMVTLGFVFALLTGTFLTADSLSGERRDGTLGLLFLTDLKGRDVVLGKMAATSLRAIFGLLAIIPVMALPLLLGGVTLGAYLREMLVLGVTVYLSLSLGLCVSAFCQNSRHPTLITLFVLAGVNLLGGLAVIVIGELRWCRVEDNPIGWFCSWAPYLVGMGDIYQRTPNKLFYWASITTQTLTATGMLSLACWVLPRTWHKDSSVRSSRKARSSGASTEVEKWKRSRDPAFWLASRQAGGARLTQWVLGVALVIWACFFVLCFNRRFDDLAFGTCLFGAFFIHQLLKFAHVVEASRALGDDQSTGALELLLVTPLSEQALLQGHRWALLRKHGVLIAATALMSLALLWLILVPDPVRLGSKDRLRFGWVVFSGFWFLLLDLAALRWMGLLAGLRRHRHYQSAGLGLVQVMAIPWLLLFLFVFLTTTNIINSSRAMDACLMFYSAISALWSWGCLAWARRRLQTRFRHLAAGTKGD